MILNVVLEEIYKTPFLLSTKIATVFEAAVELPAYNCCRSDTSSISNYYVYLGGLDLSKFMAISFGSDGSASTERQPMRLRLEQIFMGPRWRINGVEPEGVRGNCL